MDLARQILQLLGPDGPTQHERLLRQVHQLTLYLKRPFFAALTWI